MWGWLMQPICAGIGIMVLAEDHMSVHWYAHWENVPNMERIQILAVFRFGRDVRNQSLARPLFVLVLLGISIFFACDQLDWIENL